MTNLSWEKYKNGEWGMPKKREFIPREEQIVAYADLLRLMKEKKDAIYATFCKYVEAGCSKKNSKGEWNLDIREIKSLMENISKGEVSNMKILTKAI